MTRRKVVFVLLFLPVIFLCFTIGWSLYRIGSQRKSGRLKTGSTPSNLKFFALTPEEEKEATDKHCESRSGKNGCNCT